MSGLEIAVAAIELAGTLEHVIEAISECAHNYRQYSSNAENNRLRLAIEADRMKATKSILFGMHGGEGKGIFPLLDFKTQLDIVNVLRHFRELLKLNFQVIDEKYHIVAPTTLSILDKATPLESLQNGTLSGRLRWTFGGKKKLEGAIQDLTSWNDRLFSIVQTHYLRISSSQASSTTSLPAIATKSVLAEPGMSEATEYLHLTNDAKKLKLATSIPPSERPGEDLDQYLDCLTAIERQKLERLVRTFNGVSMLLESKAYVADHEGMPFRSTASRIAQLVSILNENPTHQSHALKCLGYMLDNRYNQYILAFALPSSASTSYQTLNNCFRTCHTPALDDRFALARALAMSLSQLFAVGWIHKSVSSKNLVFFSSNQSGASFGGSPEHDWQSPYLLGYDYARPESEFSSNLVYRDELQENIYRHPDQWGLPTTRFAATHDVYSLGVILLEITVWKPAISLHKTKFVGVELGSFVEKCFLDCARHHRISAAMGKRYQQVVLRCLQGTIQDDAPSDIVNERKSHTGSSGTHPSVPPDIAKEKSRTLFLESFNENVVNVLDDLMRSL